MYAYRSGSVSTLRAYSSEHCSPPTQGTDFKLQEPDYSLKTLIFVSAHTLYVEKFKVHFAGPKGHMHTVKQLKYKHEI